METPIPYAGLQNEGKLRRFSETLDKVSLLVRTFAFVLWN